MSRRHIFIPDTQIKPGVPTEFLSWIGEYVFEKKPDVLIHAGDHADMPSLSSYDRGKIQMEGRRYRQDIEAANRGFDTLMEPLYRHNRHRTKKLKEKQWWPRMVITLGNHEDRIRRAVEDNPELDGTVSTDDLNYADHGWEVVPFLEPILIDGLYYSHYFYNPLTGRPYGGMPETRLKNIGHSFVQGHEQTKKMAEVWLGNGEVRRALICGACLTPDHKVLTADLNYVPLGDVREGDHLVSFEEHPSNSRCRDYKTGTVQAVKRDVDEVFAVTLDNGKVFKVTGDHYWLTRVGGPTAHNNGSSYKWRQTNELRRGTVIPKVLDEWEPDNSRDGGYLAGMYDGEGTLYARQSGPENRAVMQLSFAQVPGPVLDDCIRIIHDLVGTDSLTHTNQRGVVGMRLKGGIRQCVKMLGKIRPIRLLNKFRPELMGGLKTNTNNKIVDIQPIGKQEIVRISIDHKTMIVEGYPHHNCYLHSEEYKGPQGNNHFRGIFVLNEVRGGNYDLMEVSLNYLCRKYEGVPLSKYMQKYYPGWSGWNTGFRKDAA